MNNNSLQGDLQEAIRNALNCANSYEGDLYALCNLYGVADGAVSGRLIPVAQKHSPTIGTASGALNYFLQNPTVLPSMGLNFVDGTDRLDSRVTFTRASNAWRFNSSGVLTQATTNTPRFDYDPTTLAPRGLLIEEQRTNLALQSTLSSSWVLASVTRTLNSIASPDGTVSANKFEATAADSSVSQIGVAVSASTAYTFSIYLKADVPTAVNIFIIDSGGGSGNTSAVCNVTTQWQRFSVTRTTSVGTTTCTVQIGGGNTFSTGESVYAWGAQLEAGAFATSYIPTTTAAATRAADVAVMTGTNFSSWYNATASTLFVEATCLGGKASSFVVRVQDSTATTNYITVRQNAGGTQMLAQASSAGGTTAGLGTTNYTVGTPFKIAIAAAASDVAASFNSGTVGTSTAMTSMPVVDRLTFAADGAWYIRRLADYPRRLSNSELQAITS